MDADGGEHGLQGVEDGLRALGLESSGKQSVGHLRDLGRDFCGGDGWLDGLDRIAFRVALIEGDAESDEKTFRE